MTTPAGPVVVGVDGSERSVAAALWAADEARWRRAELSLVLGHDRLCGEDALRETLQSVADRLAARHPGLEVRPEIAHGPAAAELIDRSARAALVVVGSRGRSTTVGALLGSVSTKVATHARCPVVVVREPRHEGPVVVGLDGSPHSQAALRFAFDAAAERNTDLVAMEVWAQADVEHPILVVALDIDWEEHEERVRRSLAEQLAGWRETYPNVAVHAVAQRGHVVLELTRAARNAQLLVVGHRGRGGFAGLLLGSVAAGVLHYAPRVTTAVVRDSGP